MREKERWLQKVVQERWLRHRSLERQKNPGNEMRFSERGWRQHCRGTEEFFWEFWEKEYWWNWSRKLRTEERRVTGKSPGHGAEKRDFQVWPFVFFFFYIFSIFFHTVQVWFLMIFHSCLLGCSILVITN